jgi:hypothetical protein
VSQSGAYKSLLGDRTQGSITLTKDAVHKSSQRLSLQLASCTHSELSAVLSTRWGLALRIQSARRLLFPYAVQ